MPRKCVLCNFDGNPAQFMYCGMCGGILPMEDVLVSETADSGGQRKLVCNAFVFLGKRFWRLFAHGYEDRDKMLAAVEARFPEFMTAFFHLYCGAYYESDMLEGVVILQDWRKIYSQARLGDREVETTRVVFEPLGNGG